MAPNKISVAVRYSKPGTQPPVYLAGSFSNWQPEEMQYTALENNEFEFHKDVQVAEGGEYQYKFRLGPGDWWILNENSPTVTDDVGNRNNLLKAPVQETSNEPITPKDAPRPSTPTTEAPRPVAAMEHTADEPVAESMGTRETSDILFDEEIVKDAEGPSGLAAAEHPHEPTSAPVPVPAHSAETIERPSSPVEEHKASGPTLIVEKEDSGLRHGDDFGVEATTAQKDAHLLHANDAEPDYIVIGNGSRTPELASIAAEVAESAAILDHEDAEPPISDEEAGRIGFRRMSMTPIPEVASTAAEVADVAAALDEDSNSRPHTPILRIPQPGDDDYEWPETPPHEKVPLFPHECPSPPSGHVQPAMRREEVVQPRARHEDREIDPNDPSVLPFPEDRAGIMQLLSTLTERHEREEALAEASDDHHLSPTANQDRSPSLDSIAEENDEEQDSHTSVPAITNGHPELTSLSKHNDDTELPHSPENDTYQTASILSIGTEEVDRSAGRQIEEVPSIKVEDVGSEQDSGFGSDSPDDKMQDQSGFEKTSGNEEEPTAADRHRTKEDSVPLQNQASAEVKTQENEAMTIAKHHGAKMPEQTSEVDVQEAQPNLAGPVEHSLDGVGAEAISTAPHVLPQPVNPFVVDNSRDVDNNENEVTKVPANKGPNIMIEPATPGSGLDPDSSGAELLDTAKASAVEEENGHVSVRSRKSHASPERPRTPYQRPLTPNSVRSAGKEAKDRNFLRAFFRTVFVEWIGGFIMRLCGGRRRTLLAVTAVTLVAIAPAVYYST